MAIFLLIIGCLTGLVCLGRFFDVLTGPIVAATAGVPSPVTAVDIIVLGVYLTVTVVCFAGAGIINAIKATKTSTTRARSVVQSLSENERAEAAARIEGGA